MLPLISLISTFEPSWSGRTTNGAGAGAGAGAGSCCNTHIGRTFSVGVRASLFISCSLWTILPTTTIDGSASRLGCIRGGLWTFQMCRRRHERAETVVFGVCKDRLPCP